MKIAKQAVAYYTAVTEKGYDDFYSNLDEALVAVEPTGELWLIQKLMSVVLKSGMSLNEFKANKDAIRGTVDEEKRKNEGEFYTPLLWCEEGRKYFDKHIPNWEDYTVWDGSCGSGNLMRTSGHKGDKLFLSTLRKEDAEDVQKTFPEATVFPLDFLNNIDWDDANLEFFDQLPEKLQSIIRNDEPLIFYMNPPYKAGSAKGTDVGNYMCSIGLGKPACDIYYQFMWRVMSLVERFRLSNCYFNCFGPLTFFTGVSAGMLLREFEHCFEFVDGMCLSAQEFSDTSDSIVWGIGCSLWKARGGYQKEALHRDVLLERKFKLPDGTIGTDGRVLYAPPRQKLSEWVKPRDVIRNEQAPLMTSHLSFKGGEGKVAPLSGKMSEGALGTLMIGNTLTRSSDQSAILSMPTTIQYTSITEENFWRCVASFSFRRIYITDWATAKKELSAPVVEVEGYNKWVMNSLVMFLFEWKSMMSSLRDVDWQGQMTDIRNKLFYCSADEIRANCTDEVILADLESHPQLNTFVLEQIELSRPYWVDEIRDLFDFCKSYTLFSLDKRKETEYKGSCECWDAGIQQVRTCCWSEELEEQLKEKIAKARDWLRSDILNFGFIVEED